jgi:PE-PPE domain
MTRVRSLFGYLILLFVVAIAVLLGAPAWAAYVIYVQGTNSIIPGRPSAPITNIFNGSFNAGNTVQIVSYPATIGWLSILTFSGPVGSLPPTLNQSVAIGVQNLDAQIKADQAAMKKDPSVNPDGQIYVIGYSQGAIVGTEEALALTAQGPSAYQNVTFILAGNPDRAAPSGGGVLTQIPGTISILGLFTIGGGFLSTPPPTNGPKIIDVANQGDPFANFTGPLGFLFGLFSVLFGSTSPHDYTNTDLTPAMVASGNFAPGYVVTKTGNLTDVFIPSTTPSPLPQVPAPLAPPVKKFQQVRASVQPDPSTPKLTLPVFAVAPAQPGLPIPKPFAMPPATQQSIKPVDIQQATNQIRAQLASIKPIGTEQQLVAPGGKHK